jgi:pimeloyl-ACP methyl ester carboxylesterase
MRFGVLTVLVAWLVTAAPVCAQEIVRLDTRPGVTQSYFLARVPRGVQAVALLFPGGGGSIRLRSEDGRIKFAPGNFLVRVRGEFVQRGVVAAILDAPSDAQSAWGMTDEFRFGDAHLTDVRAVLADLGRRFPDLPVFLIGTSRGTVSVASLGARLDRGVAGVVLTSSMYRPAGARSHEPGPGLSQFDFARLKLPVLLVHHRDDGCFATPYVDAYHLARTFPLVTVKGGRPATSGECEPMSAHGYFGREVETVEAIVSWMLKRPYAREIGDPPGR